MVSSKQLRERLTERTGPALKVETNKNNTYTNTPKKDIYKLDHSYGGYKLVKQNKGSSGKTDLSDQYSAKEMEIYLKGAETGANIRANKNK